jgi:hypothetical protein
MALFEELRMKLERSAFLSLTYLLAAVPLLRADLVEHVTLNTAALVGDAVAPFYLDFQLNGSAGNQAILSNFTFGAGGSAASFPTLIGGATGSLSTSVKLAETGFLNEFTQQFNPGASLSFDLDLGTEVAAHSFPDEFTFAILDRTGSDLPTTGPFDVFLSVDVAASPLVGSFGSDPSRAPVGGGAPLKIPAAALVAPASSVPEPGPPSLLLVAGAALLSFSRLRSPVCLKIRKALYGKTRD